MKWFLFTTHKSLLYYTFINDQRPKSIKEVLHILNYPIKEIKENYIIDVDGDIVIEEKMIPSWILNQTIYSEYEISP